MIDLNNPNNLHTTMRTKQLVEQREAEVLALRIVNDMRELVEKLEGDNELQSVAYHIECQHEELYNNLVNGEVMN